MGISHPQTKPLPKRDAKRRNYIAFTISGWKPLPKNKILGPRGNYLLMADKRTVELVANLFKNLNRWPDGEGKKNVRITIEKGPGGRVEDYDNFLHYLKPILDGLTRTCQCSKCAAVREGGGGKFLPGHKQIGAALLYDDSPKWVEWDIISKFGLQTNTHIEIWDA